MASELTRTQRVVVTIGVLMGMLLASLDQTIVGTALPRIAAELNGLAAYAWVGTAYLVASATMVPIAGRLGDLFGRKLFIVVGMAGFLGASALCGLSQTMLELIVFRGIQGLFGGILMSSVFAVVADLYPPKVRAKMQGIFSGTFALAAVIGPTLGGVLTDTLGWRWVFYINLPLGVTALAVIVRGMPAVRTTASRRDIDVFGALTLAATVIPLLTALSLSRDHDWTSPLVIALVAFAIVALAVFVWIERRERHPIIPFGLFRVPAFTTAIVVGFFSAVGMFGVSLFVPLVYQGELGLTASASGKLVTPMTLGMLVGSVATGQLISRLDGYRFIGTGGVALQAVGMWLLAQVGPGSAEADVVRDIVLIGVGTGFAMPLYQNALMSAVPLTVVGVASSQLQFWRQMGATASLALLGTILSHRLARSGVGADSELGGITVPIAARAAISVALHDAFLVATGLIGIALVASLFMRDVPLRGHTERERADIPATSFAD
ncbi:MAG TPA: MDR family MFS transporter [Candidatus Limnocylindria bacterium]|nr:MDR family MFS transporter [Candidatus Limnocylindria bacterium]